MSYTIDIVSRARTDIRSVVNWRSQQSASSAARWHAGLLNAIRSLCDNPERCPLADEAADLGMELRELLYGRRRNIYRILFTIEEQTVNVLRVRHAAQDRLSGDEI